MTKTHEQIRQRIEKIPLGKPFLPASLGISPVIRYVVDLLIKEGTVRKIAHGIFARVEANSSADSVMDPHLPQMIVEAIADVDGATIQIDGAEAAYRLRLTNKVPAQIVYLTSGPSHNIRLGGTVIRMLPVSSRRLVLADSWAGIAITAMRYLGKENVTPDVVKKIKCWIGTEDFAAIKSAGGAIPAWIHSAIRRSKL